ncbi:MAG TPA: pitrilysin family protein [Chitinophagaceae bacterium]|nr:pitrilysin family protein [Chitinophagaceae bacterium]
MKKILVIILLALPVSIFSQPKLPPGYFWQKLSNGLEVVVIENNKVPLATIEIAVKNGAYTEGPEYSGLSHLFEHMFFKANRDYPNQEKFLKRTQELGAIWNGTTGEERVNYYFTFNKDSLTAGLKFMNAAIRFPIYKTEDMQKERPVVDGEFQRAESDPGFQVWYESQKKLWGDLVTRKNPIGDHNVINTATPEKMMIIKDKYYYPNNSLLVICGDVKHEAAFKLANDIFGDWPRSSFNPHEKYPIPEFKPLQSTEYFIKEASIAQTPYMMYWWHGPDYRHDSAGTIAADVFSTILGMNASKWQQALVDKGLATYAGVGYQTLSHVGPVSIFVVPNPNKLNECNAEVSNQVKMWQQNNYFTDEQLADAKAIMRRNEIRRTEKPSELPHQVTYSWCSTSLDYHTNYAQNCNAVTRQDIQNYISKYITGKPYVAGIIINPEMNKAAQTSTFFKPTL